VHARTGDGPSAGPGPAGIENPASPAAAVPAAGNPAGSADAYGVQDEALDLAPWIVLEPGLHYAEFSLDRHGAGGAIAAVRIDPRYFDFVLCASGKEADRSARTLSEWGELHGLSAAVNASMYLPDGTTSTGYMRDGAYVNNPRMARRFGAFLASGPDDPSLPGADIIERDDPAWREKLDRYRMAVQNYRMVDSQRRVLWSPGGPLYSISAIAQDGRGRILFLHSRERIEAHAFAQEALRLPADLKCIMYVEGGGQAGLLVRSPRLSKVITGRIPADFLITGRLSARLPNVVGARRKNGGGRNPAMPPSK